MKPQVNYAYIDGNNLNLTMRNLGWNLDYRRFRTYLREHYGVAVAHYCIGYMPEFEALYRSLISAGFHLVFKKVTRLPDGSVKGNVDSVLVLQALIDYAAYAKAVLVTSDGDFECLVEYLRGNGKLERVLAPCKAGCAKLLQDAAGSQMDYLDNLRARLEYKKKRTP